MRTFSITHDEVWPYKEGQAVYSTKFGYLLVVKVEGKKITYQKIHKKEFYEKQSQTTFSGTL